MSFRSGPKCADEASDRIHGSGAGEGKWVYSRAVVRFTGAGSPTRSLALTSALVVLLAGTLVLLGGGRAAAGASKVTRYSLAGGCFALRAADGSYVAKAGGGYSAGIAAKRKAEPFRMQATSLGSYLFYGKARDFLGIDTELLGGGGIVAAGQPTGGADWTMLRRGGFVIWNQAEGAELAVGDGGQLVVAGTGEGERFTFKPTRGCKAYPEVRVNARGGPVKGAPRYGEVSGLIDGHMHMMAFEFLGGRAHCGKPWHRFGAPFALRDCPDHEVGNGCGAVMENVLYGNPARCHDPIGWPTFNDWPHPASLTHEQSYYKWLERAWRGGLRVFVNLTVENRVLCEVYPLKKNSCNEMDSVLLQIKRLHALEDYIDAQNGGPGKGWFRIVRNPFQARKVINSGKLAVITGMEVSEPFGCRLRNRAPTCDEADISAWIDRLHGLGVRQLEITNKFDNALTGVAGDGGAIGVAIDGFNFFTTGTFWDLGPCEDPGSHDNSPSTAILPHNDDLIIANGIRAYLPGLLPVHPTGPSCNARGLSALGAYALREIMDHRMVFDPDHQSVIGRNQALDLVERKDYPGMFSSHSWSTDNAIPRIYKLGGVVTPYAGSSEGFVHQWQHLKQFRRSKQYFGFGYGADMNGFGSQGLPRGADVPNPVTYPFKSFDGKVKLYRQHSGQRRFDINTDGVAHYGLYPDWLEDVRMIGGDRIVKQMGRGAEAYLQMWERTFGIAPRGCAGWAGKQFSARGLGTRVRLGKRPVPTLRRAGQPFERTKDWRWCAGKSSKVVARFAKGGRVGLIISTRREHRAAGVGPLHRVAKLRRIKATNLGNGLWARPTGHGAQFVYGVRAGKVHYTGVARAALAANEARLRKALTRATH